MIFSTVKHKRRFWKRVLEAVREIGTLQLTFAPLDWVLELHSSSNDFRAAIVLSISGLVMLLFAIVAEVVIGDFDGD